MGVGVPVVAPAAGPQLAMVENCLEPLYERFRKQHPPIFKGGPDPLEAEELMELITSTLDFMKVEGNDRVACASHMLRDDARILWGVVGQRRDVATMTWTEF